MPEPLLSVSQQLAAFYSSAFRSCQSFSQSKAKVTSIYMMMGGLANFVIPLITGYLSNIGLQYIIVLDFTFALLALITAIIVFIRYYRVFIIPENDVRFGEHKFSTRLNTIKHRG